VATTRVTVIHARPAPDEASGAAWLSERQGRDQADAEVDAALTIVNRALAAHRVAAGDPAVGDVTREQALVVRLGWGSGEAVADGRYAEAIEVPLAAARRRRAEALRPQERMAAILGGRDAALAAEGLALSARADVDAGREREAALGLRVALEAALAELEAAPEADRLSERIAGLREARTAVGSAANAALAGELDPASRQAVLEALRQLEGALRARALLVLDAPR
jgi:hypothetical protein